MDVFFNILAVLGAWVALATIYSLVKMGRLMLKPKKKNDLITDEEMNSIMRL